MLRTRSRDWIAAALILSASPAFAGGREDTASAASERPSPEACAPALRRAPDRERIASRFNPSADPAVLKRTRPGKRSGTYENPKLDPSGERRLAQGASAQVLGLISRFPAGTYALFKSAAAPLFYEGVVVEYRGGNPLVQRPDNSYGLLDAVRLDLGASRPNRLSQEEHERLHALGQDGQVVDRIVEEHELIRDTERLALGESLFRDLSSPFLKAFVNLGIHLGDPITVTTPPLGEDRSSPPHSFSGSYAGFTPSGWIALGTGHRYTRLVNTEALDPKGILRVGSDWRALSSGLLLDSVDRDNRHTLGRFNGGTRDGKARFVDWQSGEERLLVGGRLLSLSGDALEAITRLPHPPTPSGPPITQMGLPHGTPVIVQMSRKTIDGYYLGAHVRKIPIGVSGLENIPHGVKEILEIWIFNRNTGRIDAFDMAPLRGATVLFPEPVSRLLKPPSGTRWP